MLIRDFVMHSLKLFRLNYLLYLVILLHNIWLKWDLFSASNTLFVQGLVIL